MGKITLRNVLRDMCSRASVESVHTNHSLREAECSLWHYSSSLALGKGVPEKLIMDRTGHRDVKSLHAYLRDELVESAKLLLMCNKAPRSRVHF